MIKESWVVESAKKFRSHPSQLVNGSQFEDGPVVILYNLRKQFEQSGYLRPTFQVKHLIPVNKKMREARESLPFGFRRIPYLHKGFWAGFGLGFDPFGSYPQ